MGLALLYLTSFISKRRLFHQFYNMHNTPNHDAERVTNIQGNNRTEWVGSTGLNVLVLSHSLAITEHNEQHFPLKTASFTSRQHEVLQPWTAQGNAFAAPHTGVQRISSASHSSLMKAEKEIQASNICFEII